jgi:flagellar hook-length control protein FliK
MPVAFNPPPFPTSDALPTEHKGAAPADAVTLDQFAQLLLSMGQTIVPADAPGANANRNSGDDARDDKNMPELLLPMATWPASDVAQAFDPANQAIARGAAARYKPIAEITAAANGLKADSPTLEQALEAAGKKGVAPALESDRSQSLATKAVPVASTSRAQLAAPSTPADTPAPLQLAAAKSPPKVDVASAIAELASAPSPSTRNAHGALDMVAPAIAPPAQSNALRVDTIATPVASPGWHAEAAQKIAQVVITGNERAELKLSPPSLGPLEVRVDLKADNASVVIIAPHPETRDAIQQTLPQLRELLAGHGITLGQATVQDGSAQRNDAQDSRTPHGRSDAPRAQDDAAAPPPTRLAVPLRNRLVDTFA